MAPTIDERAAREINALGQYVLPGMVDVHMHLSPELRVTCSTFRIAAVVQKAGAIQNSADARQEYCS